MSSAIESMDSKHNQMQVDLNLIKNELYVANLRSFASKVKDAFVRLQAAVDALADVMMMRFTITLGRIWSAACAQGLIQDLVGLNDKNLPTARTQSQYLLSLRTSRFCQQLEKNEPQQVRAHSRCSTSSKA